MIHLKNRVTSTITTNTFELEIEDVPGKVKKVTYIEYLNDKNKVIDCNLRDAEGNELERSDTEALLEEIQIFVDSLPDLR